MKIDQAFQKEQFLKLPQNKQSQIIDDFSNSNYILQNQFKLKSNYNCNVNYKMYTFKDKNLQIQDEIKIEIPYQQLFFQMRANRQGNFRYYIDFGTKNNISFYAQVKQNNKLINDWIRFGVFYYKENQHVGIRLERNCHLEPFLSMRSIFNINQQIQVAFATVFSIQNMKPTVSDFMLNYTYKDYELSIKNLSQNDKHLIKIGGYRKLNDINQIAFNIQKDFQNKDYIIELGAQHKENKNNITKTKIDQNCRIFFCHQYKYNDIFSFVFFANLNPFKKEKFLGPIGLKIDINS